MRSFLLFLSGSAMVAADPRANSVMICKGSFAVRSKVCVGLDLDVIPSETMQCSTALSPSVASSWLSGAATDGVAKVDFSSKGSLRRTLDTLRTPNGLHVNFGSCENKGTNLPSLDDSSEYIVIAFLDDIAARASLSVNTLTQSESNVVEMMTELRYYSFDILLDDDFRKSLGNELSACSASAEPCLPGYTSKVVGRSAVTVTDKYLA